MDREDSGRGNAVFAVNLPVELLDLIFSYLDCKTFYHARRVCRWWYVSSSNTTTLRRQLGKLPFRPGNVTKKVPPGQLLPLFSRAADMLMFGLRVDSVSVYDHSLSSVAGSGDVRVVSNGSGDRIVTVTGRTASLWDTSKSSATFLGKRVLNQPENPLEERMELDITPISAHQLALSSDCRLLAVAWKHEIRIYDLFDRSSEAVVSHRMIGESGSCIVCVGFEEDDHVLKVKLGSKAAVMYLGSPLAEGDSLTSGDLGHWRSASGLDHVLLDSSSLRCKTSNSSLHPLARYSSVHILRYLDDGLLLAAQRHGAGESSQYVLAHVKSSAMNGPPTTIDSSSLVELVRLETYLSSRDCIVNGSGIGSWSDMPNAHPYFHTRFCLSCDGRYLILAERDKHRIFPTILSQVYVYRTPGGDMLERLQSQPEGDKIEPRLRISDVLKSNLTVSHIPVRIGSVTGEVKRLTCEATDENSTTFRISAMTSDSTHVFSISGFHMGSQ